MILSFGQTYRRSVARSRPFCPGRTTSVSSNRTIGFVFVECRYRFRSGASLQHPIARGLENFARHLTEEAFILHSQDGSAAPN